MGLINDMLDESLENELKELLQPFVQESDYFSDPWRPSPVFDYTVCIKRVVSELIKQRDLNSKIACGHSKKDLWKECHSDSIEYCTICRLHQEIEENEIKANNWRHAVESALGLESDEVNHTPEWAFDIILKIREIGNRK